MYISALSLRNFRNFNSARFNFDKGINTLIGENGSGKTNVFFALRLLLDGNLPRNVRLFESDFNRALPKWRGHWIIISIRFEELDNSDVCQSLLVHAVGDVEEDYGTYNLIYRPKVELRKKLHEYSQKDEKSEEGLAEILNSISLADYESAFRGKGKADFCDNGVYESIVGNFKTIEFPNPDEEDTSLIGQWLPNGISVPNEVSCTFVQALRDVETELKSYRSSPLLNLLRNSDSGTDTKEKEELLGQIKNLNSKVGELNEIKTLSSNITRSIQGAIGYTYAPNVDIRSEIPDDVERLFQSLKLWVGDPDDANYLGKLRELSLGGANMIYLSLKLLEYEQLQSQNRAAHFLLIEEPEAHIHTHIQKTLFKKVHLNKTQVIVSTHSTHISSTSKAHSINILSRNNKYADVFHPTSGLEPGQVNGIERYLDAVRSTLLFAKGVVMVEGDAEQIVLPVLIEKVLGVSLDELGVSLVNIGSTGFENLAVLFHKDRVRRRCAILTDLDEIAVAQGDVTAKEWAHYENSRDAGLERKNKLDGLFDQNKWVKISYAPYTFEVDFLQAGNSSYIKSSLKDIYANEDGAYVKSSEAKLDDATPTTNNLEVLRLAKKVGKGWFAILVAKQIDSNTIVPDYILEAIAFASPVISSKMKLSMVNHRVADMKASGKPEALAFEQKHTTGLAQNTNEYRQECFQDFQDTFTTDSLTKFLALL